MENCFGSQVLHSQVGSFLQDPFLKKDTGNAVAICGPVRPSY